MSRTRTAETSESDAAERAKTEDTPAGGGGPDGSSEAVPDLPDGEYRSSATTQHTDPLTGTRTGAHDPVYVSNAAMVAVNLTREERVVLLEGIGALFTLHGRGEFNGERPLPELELRALADKLRQGG